MNAISILTHNMHGRQRAFFKIRIKNDFVYMKIDSHFLGGKDVGGPEKIVIVDSNQFLELWKNDPRGTQKQHAYGNESLWRKDYKFHHAEKGFSFGISNPVPLAYIHCYFSDVCESFAKKIVSTFTGNKDRVKTIPYCSITNGITRTLWLLANGAACFPVMTDSYSYDLLQLNAGIDESEELINRLMELDKDCKVYIP